MYQGVRSNPFTTLFIGSIVIGALNIASTICYSVGVMAFRYHDQISDPWNTWTWWRHVISTTWIVPMFLYFALWKFYQSAALYTVQMLATFGYVCWGIVHVGWMIVEWTNCNDFTGLDPDVPHCINRFYPGETIPDFSFYLVFISLCVSLGCSAWWLYAGSALKTISASLLFASSIQSKVGSSISEDNQAMLKRASKHIAEAIIGDQLDGKPKDKVVRSTLRSMHTKTHQESDGKLTGAGIRKDHTDESIRSTYETFQNADELIHGVAQMISATHEHINGDTSSDV